jgi:hypothetical protein
MRLLLVRKPPEAAVRVMSHDQGVMWLTLHNRSGQELCEAFSGDSSLSVKAAAIQIVKRITEPSTERYRMISAVEEAVGSGTVRASRIELDRGRVILVDRCPELVRVKAEREAHDRWLAAQRANDEMLSRDDRRSSTGPAVPTRSSSTRSSSPPWGVRQLWPDGQFRWHRVASEADGRRLAAQLRGDGAKVEVLRMGGGRPW